MPKLSKDLENFKRKLIGENVRRALNALSDGATVTKADTFTLKVGTYSCVTAVGTDPGALSPGEVLGANKWR